MDVFIPSSLFDSRLSLAMQRLEQKLRSSRSPSEALLIQEALRCLADASDAIKPILRCEPLPVRGLLMKDHIGIPLSEAVYDISQLYQAISKLQGHSLSAINILLSEVSSLDALSLEARDRISRSRVEAISDVSSFYWIYDSFTSLERVDPLSSAHVNVRGGFASLQVIAETPLSSRISKVSIDKSEAIAGKAVPGNNSEIRDLESSTAGSRMADISPEPSPVLYKDVAASDDISVIFDGDPQTYYELESCWAPRTQWLAEVGTSLVNTGGGKRSDVYERTKKFGWRAFINWPGEANLDTNGGKGHWLINLYREEDLKPDYGGVTLGLTIELDQPTPLSLIALTPFIRESKYPELTYIEVSSDGSSWVRVGGSLVMTPEVGENDFSVLGGVPVKNDAGTKYWNVAGSAVKYIRIRMHQNAAYRCTLAHKYYYQLVKETKTTSILIFSSTKSRDDYVRVADPSTIEIGSYVVKGVPSWLQVAGGLAAQGYANKLDSPGSAKDLGYANYFDANTGERASSSSNNPLAGLGSMGAFSLAAGVLGSVYNSTKTRTPVGGVESGYDIINGMRYAVGIRDLLLLSHEYSNTSQLTTKELQFDSPVQNISIVATERIPEGWPKGKWIRYEVSVGGVWTELSPLNRVDHSGLPVVVPTNGSSFVRLRVTLTRPDNKPNESPLVLSYAIKGDPASD